MIIYDGPVIPDDLTEFVRVVPLPAYFVLNQILPDVYIDTNVVDIGELTRTNRTARFRAYDANLHRAQRDAATLTRVHLPALSDTLGMGEYERLQLEFARTNGTNESAFVNAIYNDAETVTRYVNNRMEQARGDVLTDGKFTLTGEGGLTLEADYGVPSGNFVTAAVLWDHLDGGGLLDADILTDLYTWTKNYRLLNGFNPGGMWISQDILHLLLANSKLRQTAGTLLGSALFLTQDQLAQQLAARNLPPIAGIYDSMVDVDGTATRITPDNKIIFVPPAETRLGRTVWGVTATALELVNSSEADLAFQDAAGIVGVIDKSGPPYRQYTFVDAVGMPVIDRPRALMVATVSA